MSQKLDFCEQIIGLVPWQSKASLSLELQQSHYREVPQWEIFMEQELRYRLDLGQMADFPAFIASKSFDLWNHHIPQKCFNNLWYILIDETLKKRFELPQSCCINFSCTYVLLQCIWMNLQELNCILIKVINFTTFPVQSWLRLDFSLFLFGFHSIFSLLHPILYS